MGEAETSRARILAQGRRLLLCLYQPGKGKGIFLSVCATTQDDGAEILAQYQNRLHQVLNLLQPKFPVTVAVTHAGRNATAAPARSPQPHPEPPVLAEPCQGLVLTQQRARWRSGRCRRAGQPGGGTGRHQLQRAQNLPGLGSAPSLAAAPTGCSPGDAPGHTRVQKPPEPVPRLGTNPSAVGLPLPPLGPPPLDWEQRGEVVGQL